MRSHGSRRRHTTAKRVALAFAGALVLLLLWSVLIEPRLLVVKREVAAVPGLPPAWEGRQVALFADLQIGMWLGNPDTGRDVVRRLLAHPPAVVLIAGDFLQSADQHQDALIAEAVGIVRPLPAAGIPTYAVLGNHDYSLNRRNDPENDAMARALAAALERAGIRVLQNAAVPLPTPTGASADSLYLVGIGSHWADKDDPRAALAQVPAGEPRLVFMHNPATFAEIAAGRAPIAFAAHTHGGQVRIPFTPDWTWLSWVRGERVYSDGWTPPSDGAPGNRLYINRGIGMSELPVRFNCRPELTLFTLRRAGR